jgi:hypothetical protein
VASRSVTTLWHRTCVRNELPRIKSIDQVTNAKALRLHHRTEVMAFLFEHSAHIADGACGQGRICLIADLSPSSRLP